MDKLRIFVEKIFYPLALIFINLGVPPNIITVIGFLTALSSSIQILFGNQFFGGILILISGFFDIMDGFVARISGLTSKLGGFLDSVLDRFSDAFIFSSIIYSGICELNIGLIVLIGSFMVSYIRCKGECLGVSLAGVGLAERSERLIIISLGLILNMVYISMYLLCPLIIFTIVERFYRILKILGD
ncbi:MAG: archaetidylinositol phosphate synthase [Candidatus Methanomethylicia archaeon]|nr:archaetidylinositol phosphate synthase [Candidatus Methanomethylicia archaeon]MCX8168868.1 archaetidylinositol phosphate synthase [Candidatus Methanomethylicia archaeon]MDW7988600.1 archaetidylinositol phosphate synthase [Nitrososphaerota archaeon]